MFVKHVGLKRWFCIKLIFSSLFSTLIWNARLLRKVTFFSSGQLRGWMTRLQFYNHSDTCDIHICYSKSAQVGVICVICVICMIIITNALKNTYFRWNVSDLCDMRDLIIFYLLLFAYINRFSVSRKWDFFFFNYFVPLTQSMG